MSSKPHEPDPKPSDGRHAVAAPLARQAAELGDGLDEDEAMAIANEEVHAMRRERPAG